MNAFSIGKELYESTSILANLLLILSCFHESISNNDCHGRNFYPFI